MVDVSKVKVFEDNEEVAEAKVSPEGALSIRDMIAEAEDAIEAMPEIAGYTRTSNGICSVSVVNSDSKRITFSKALSLKLGLTDKVNILPNVKTGELMVASHIASPKTCRGKLSGKAKAMRTCYNSNMVAFVTKAFDLDFSERVSRSFSNIRFVEEGGTIYAFVTMGKSQLKKSEAIVEEIGQHESEEELEEFEFDEYEDDIEEVTEE